MAEATTSAQHRDGAEGIAMWIEDHKAIVYSLIALRQLGPSADDAVEAVLHVPSVRSFVASWDLWDAIVSADGGDADALLEEHLARPLLDAAKVAIGRPAMVLRLLPAS